MATFDVEYECRKVGALGRFERWHMRVQAENEDAAREAVRAKLYAERYEHVHTLRVGEVFNPMS